MIPRKGPRVEQLPPLALYREDLEKLVSLFKQHCQNVTIGDEEHLYDSLDEMAEHAPARLRCFVVAGVIPHAELVVRGSYSIPLAVQRSTLWTMDRDPRSDVVFLTAKDLLSERKRLFLIALRIGILFAAAALLIGCLFAKTITGHQVVNDFEYNIVVLGAFGLLVAGVLMRGKQPSLITLERRSKSQSFWIRNKETFMTTAVTAAISGLVGYLIGHFLKK